MYVRVRVRVRRSKSPACEQDVTDNSGFMMDTLSSPRVLHCVLFCCMFFLDPMALAQYTLSDMLDNTGPYDEVCKNSRI